MSNNFEMHVCYFCDEPKLSPYYIENYNEAWICNCCINFTLPINHDKQQNGECCVCLECKILVKLPTCIHTLCLECCKSNYFGSTINARPIHWREIPEKTQMWYCELNDDDENDPERIKQDEYNEFEYLHFDYETKTYDELIIIRNSLIDERPEWMNDIKFINYENMHICYELNMVNVEKEFDNYNETKIIGNECCPLCRALPI